MLSLHSLQDGQFLPLGKVSITFLQFELGARGHPIFVQVGGWKINRIVHIYCSNSISHSDILSKSQKLNQIWFLIV